MWIDDEVLAFSESPLAVFVWRPEKTLVVLGRGCHVETDCHSDHAAVDSVPIVQRYGGGGTVLLHAGCVVVSVGVWVASPFDNTRYFSSLNQTVMTVLSRAFPELGALCRSGISDISDGARKVAGTSLFRSRRFLLYQASILCDTHVDLICRYLKHPPREPDYRRGRGHRSFMVGLSELCVRCSPEEVARILTSGLAPEIEVALGAELHQPDPRHVESLELRRIAGIRDDRENGVVCSQVLSPCYTRAAIGLADA